MYSSGGTDDCEETQRLNPDSPPSDFEDCTLPLDKGELDKDNGCFYGETQALEEDVDGAVLEAEEQKVKDFSLLETQVVDCSEDDSERTLQLSDVDDGETSFRGVGSDGKKTHHLEEEHPKCSSVDYDGSTEEDGRSGSRRRSIADFRVASLRANNLSGSKVNCKPIDAEKTISEVEDNVTGAESVKKLEKNNVLSYAKDVFASPETSMCELQFSCEKDKWGKSTENDYTNGIDQNGGSRTARRLFYNETGLEKIHPIDKLNVECDQEKADTMVYDYSVIGLSYNTSQEPGELSQANAIKVVDTFLALNDLEISEDAGLGKTGEFKTPLNSNFKGAQYLAKMSSKSPIDKSAAFDWVDALEDESGGDFFSKRKCSIFAKSISGKKTRSCSRKPRQLHPEKSEDIFENGNQKRNARHTSLSKIKSLSLSNTKVKANLTGDKKLLTSTIARKDLFKENKSSLVADSTIQYLDRGEETGGTAVTWDVGPDTQMAAQALESMICGPIPGNDSSEACLAARDIIFSNQNSMTKKGSPGHDSQLKRISPISHLIGDKKRYVKKKMSTGKIINETLISSTRKLRSSRMKECSEEATLVECIDMKSKQEEPSNGKYISSRRSKISIKRLTGQEEGQMDIEKMDSENTCLQGVELPLNKESLQVNDRWSSPVAHRTRRSRERKSLGISHGFFNGDPGKVKYWENDDSGQATVCSFESNAIQNEQQITSSHFNMQVDEVPKQDAQRSGPDPILVISCHPKRRRTRGAYAEEVNTINLDLQCDLQRTKFSISAVHNLEKANTDSMALTQGHSKSKASRKLKTRPSDTPQSSPSNKIKEAASPVCIGTCTPKDTNNKRLSGSSLKREVRRLHSTIQTSTPVLKYSQRRNDMATICILFSCHLDDDIVNKQKKILARLKLPVASSISDATHFISDKFVRTRNMLVAMSVGKPVVTPLWLESCDKAGFCVDEKNYILKDLKKEKEVGFSMTVSLARACERPLLQDKRVFITANVKPDRRTVSSLVKASGGQPLERIIRSLMKHDVFPEDLLVISCEEDFRICMPLLEKGSEVFSSELILNGIVVQKLEYERHRLFSDHVRRTRSTIFLRNENTDKFHPVPKFKQVYTTD